MPRGVFYGAPRLYTLECLASDLPERVIQDWCERLFHIGVTSPPEFQQTQHAPPLLYTASLAAAGAAQLFTSSSAAAASAARMGSSSAGAAAAGSAAAASSGRAGAGSGAAAGSAAASSAAGAAAAGGSGAGSTVLDPRHGVLRKLPRHWLAALLHYLPYVRSVCRPTRGVPATKNNTLRWLYDSAIAAGVATQFNVETVLDSMHRRVALRYRQDNAHLLGLGETERSVVERLQNQVRMLAGSISSLESELVTQGAAWKRATEETQQGSMRLAAALLEVARALPTRCAEGGSGAGAGSSGSSGSSSSSSSSSSGSGSGGGESATVSAAAVAALEEATLRPVSFSPQAQLKLCIDTDLPVPAVFDLFLTHKVFPAVCRTRDGKLSSLTLPSKASLQASTDLASNACDRFFSAAKCYLATATADQHVALSAACEASRSARGVLEELDVRVRERLALFVPEAEAHMATPQLEAASAVRAAHEATLVLELPEHFSDPSGFILAARACIASSAPTAPANVPNAQRNLVSALASLEELRVQLEAASTANQQPLPRGLTEAVARIRHAISSVKSYAEASAVKFKKLSNTSLGKPLTMCTLDDFLTALNERHPGAKFRQRLYQSGLQGGGQQQQLLSFSAAPAAAASSASASAAASDSTGAAAGAASSSSAAGLAAVPSSAVGPGQAALRGGGAAGGGSSIKQRVAAAAASAAKQSALVRGLQGAAADMGRQRASSVAPAMPSSHLLGSSGSGSPTKRARK